MSLADGLVQTRRSSILDEVEAVVDWVPLQSLLGKRGSDGAGNSSYPAEVLLRCLLAGIWHNLSDPALEAAVADRLSFRRFVGLSLHTHAPLFDKILNLAAVFSPVVERLQLGTEVTPYALRHSSIVRQLLKGVPTRVVAAHHDTSVAMIEKNYSRYIIGDPTEAMTRATLLDFENSTSLARAA